jgi:alpha-L-fucosidase
VIAAGEKREVADKVWSPADIRFTVKGATLYAMGLERPKDGAVLVKTLYSGTPYLERPIAKVELLGGTAPLRWQQTAKGLEVSLPADPGGTMPYALRITL